MFTRIQSWLVAHPRWTLSLLVLALLGPFLDKAFNIDDPLFIWLARQVREHPGDPFGFPINWCGNMLPMWRFTDNPPLAGYIFALTESVLGRDEIGFHGAGLLAALAVVLGTHRLARRVCGQPLLAACALLFTPVFLVSANTVMCDMPMLAFWIWAVVFWLEGLEQNHRGKIIASGVLIGLAFLTKYFGLALVPLLAVHGALERRRPGWWLAGLMIPLTVFAAYVWWIHWLYGQVLFVGAIQFAVASQHGQGFSKLSRGLIALAFAGSGAASVVFLAPLLWRPRKLVLIATATVLAGGIVCVAGPVLQKFAATQDAATRTGITVQFIGWLTGGVLVLWLAVAEVFRNPRASVPWLLALWVGGTLFFTAFDNWTINGRCILPLLPAVGILVARRWETGGPKRSWPLAVGLTASALLALLVARADFQLAGTARQSTSAVLAEYGKPTATVWFEGHWGFQYYMEQQGAKAVAYKNFAPQPGDILVIPMNNSYIQMPLPELVASDHLVSTPNPACFATCCSPLGAGFYSFVFGPLPFVFGRVPPEDVMVYELKAPGAK